MGCRRVEPRIWEDWYSPADYIGQAGIIAREFCEAHPDADETFVYGVATDAAMIYELGGVHSEFRLYVEIKIRTAIYNNRRIRMSKFSQRLKEAVILDRMNGIPAKTIAEQQGLTPKQVENIFTMYKQKQKASEAAEHVEAEAVSETKQVEAEPAVPAEYPGQINDNVESDVKVFLPGDEVKQPIVIKPINVFAALLAMQQFINAIAEGAEITEAAASAGNDAHVSFSFGGADYGLELKRL